MIYFISNAAKIWLILTAVVLIAYLVYKAARLIRSKFRGKDREK